MAKINPAAKSIGVKLLISLKKLFFWLCERCYVPDFFIAQIFQLMSINSGLDAAGSDVKDGSPGWIRQPVLVDRYTFNRFDTKGSSLCPDQHVLLSLLDLWFLCYFLILSQ